MEKIKLPEQADKRVPLSEIPYGVKVINAADQTKKVTLFDPEFRDEYVIIKAINPGVEYKEMMYNNEHNPWFCRRILVECANLGPRLPMDDNPAERKFDGFLTVTTTNVSGGKEKIKMTIPHMIIPALWLDRIVWIEQNTMFAFMMPPECWFRFYFYQKE